MELARFTIAVAQAALGLALLFAVPGVTIGALILPSTRTPLGVTGRTVGVSLLSAASSCTLLARFGLLTDKAVLGTLVALTLLPLLSARVRHEVRATFSPARRGRRAWVIATLGLLAAAALVVGPSRAAVGDDLLPYTSTVWYYANLARTMAELGSIPGAIPEWGSLRPFQTDYLPVSAHTAAGLLLLPGDLLADLELYRLAVLFSAIVLAALLIRRWFSPWMAVLGAVLLLGTERLAFKFVSYKPETFGLILALFTLWLLDRALAERSWRVALVAVWSAALTFLAHAEVFLLLGPAAVGMSAARTIVGGGGRIGFRSLDGVRRRSRRSAGALALVALGGLAGASTLATLTGEVGILRYGDPTRLGEPHERRQPDIAPVGWVWTSDPTWDFYVAAVAPSQLGEVPPDSFTDASLLPRSILHVWPGLDARRPNGLLVLAPLLAIPLAAWPWLDTRRRRALVAWWMFGGGVLGGSVLLFVLGDTYVPERIGPRRLMPYQLFIPVISAVVAIWGVDRLLRDGWRALLPGRGAMAAAGIALFLLAAGAVSDAPGDTPDDREPGLTTVGYEAYRWIDENLPQDARIVANAYTDGSLTTLARRSGLLDGRAVYLEDQAFLDESTALVLGARVLFAMPSSDDAMRFLDRHRVGYLLVAGPDGGDDLGGYQPFETDRAALDWDARYRLVQAFDGGRILLYEVVRAVAAPG